MEAQDLEIVMGLLTPRVPGARAPSQRARRSEALRVVPLVKASREAFEKGRAAGDPLAMAILALGEASWSDEGIAGLETAMGASAESDSEGIDDGQLDDDSDAGSVAAFIHDSAVEVFRSGQISHAVVLYGTLLHLKQEQAEALSGLALCGVRLGRFDDALMLANECLKLPVKHPRAYCIAGFCELERGNRKAAQSLLALGARISRNRPEFAEDLRAAQRVLLILHFS